jgi:hypothetical protein
MPPIKTAFLRREKELQEFLNETSWKNVRMLSDDKVELYDAQGTHWIVQRNLNFHTTPPRVWKEEEEIIQPQECWNPSISSVEWLRMTMKKLN